MNDVIIKAENLGKKYVIGHQAENGRYVALRDVLMHNARNLWNKTKDLAQGKPIIQGDTMEEVWALKDVSFEIKRGEAVGIIGRNGAGKSALLKILSRITEPTTGRVTIKGRVASLLEVGTGFHPELSGRENIYLNGTILGMTRAEIKRKFDEIVAFAEVEKYLDTPVKRYSSGMYVRLAFAVAAHLEPEILVVDEVLAVGDTQFQKKCLGKMDNVTKQQGRTVLFVSHNMGAIEALCEKTLFLNFGQLIKYDLTKKIITLYLSEIHSSSHISLKQRIDRGGTGDAKITALYIAGPDCRPLQQILSGLKCKLVLEYESSTRLTNPKFKITVYNGMGQPLLHFDNSLAANNIINLGGKGIVGCNIQKLPLSRGTYRINASIENNGQLLDHVIGAYTFNVDEGNFYGTGRNIIGLKEICLTEQEWFNIPE